MQGKAYQTILPPLFQKWRSDQHSSREMPEVVRRILNTTLPRLRNLMLWIKIMQIHHRKFHLVAHPLPWVSLLNLFLIRLSPAEHGQPSWGRPWPFLQEYYARLE